MQLNSLECQDSACANALHSEGEIGLEHNSVRALVWEDLTVQEIVESSSVDSSNLTTCLTLPHCGETRALHGQLIILNIIYKRT